MDSLPLPAFASRPGHRSRSSCIAGLWLAALVIQPALAEAQRNEEFVGTLLALAETLQGERAGGRSDIDALLVRARTGLATWDQSIVQLEQQVQRELAGAAPQRAARLRTSLAGAYLERGRSDDALREIETATRLDPTYDIGWMLHGVAGEAVGDPDRARRAYLAAFAAAPSDAAAAYNAARMAADGSPQRTAAMRILLAAHARLLTPAAAAAPTRFMRVAPLDDGSLAHALFLPHHYAAALAPLSRRQYDIALSEIMRRWSDDPLRQDAAVASPLHAEVSRLVQRGDPGAALARLAAADRSDARTSEMHRLEGIALEAAGRLDQAVVAMQAAVTAGPWNERAHVELATILVKANDVNDAERVLQQARTRFPRSAAITWMQTGLHASRGRDVEMIDSLAATLEIGVVAGTSSMLSSLGRLQLRGLDLEAAERTFRTNVMREPNGVQARLDLAEFSRLQGRFDEALAEYVAVLLIDPSHPGAHTSIGQMHLEAGRFAEAAQVLELVVSREPDLSEARYGLAIAWLRLGRSEAGRQQLDAFRQLQARESESFRRSYQLATLRLDARMREAGAQWRDALVIRQRIVELEPQFPGNYISVADTLIRLGDLSAAAERLERAAALGASSSVYRTLADVYERLGRTERSKDAARQFDAASRDARRSVDLER